MRALLDAEEEQYLLDIDSQQETTLERQAKMRARAKELREKREQERLALVEEKLDIRWRLLVKFFVYLFVYLFYIFLYLSVTFLLITR